MPHTHSHLSTNEQRVAAKRSRQGASTAEGGATASEAAKVSASKKQIGESRAAVDAAVEKALELTTDIKTNAESREDKRRRAQMDARRKRMQTVEQELVESGEKNRHIETQWAEIAQKDIPQELYREIALQYKAASALIATKEELIAELQRDLKHKDENYVEQLTQHQNDVTELVRRMHAEFAAVLTSCKVELRNVEKVFVTERRELLDANKAAIEALFDKRRDMELAIMEQRQTTQDGFQDELTTIRGSYAEDYNSLKVTLDNNIQLLEQQLEEMRATYQLNTEKLEYNHSVLEERDAENKQTVEHHRQRLRRLKEALSAHAQKFVKQDTRFRHENAELTDEYKRVTEQFKDLQKKFRHFEMVDTKKYRDVWEMNEQEVMRVVKKVLKADKLIHEQILGLPWQLPFRDSNATVRDAAAGESSTYADINNLTSATIANSISTDGDGLQATLKRTLVRGGGDGGGDGGDGAEQAAAAAAKEREKASVAKAPKTGKFSAQKIQSVLAMLSQETQFLVDSKVRETLVGLSQEEALMHTVDAILAALGVEDQEDVDELVGFFYADQDFDEPSVHPNDLVKVVRDFVVQRQNKALSSGGSGSAVSGGDAAGGKVSSSVVMKHDINSEKRARKKKKEIDFWHRLANVISERTSRVWAALEKDTRRYNALLEDRQATIDETTSLAQQNDELKVLLQEYLGSKINQDLVIPPTRLIQVQK
jgi:dynein regulatory complex protein 1